MSIGHHDTVELHKLRLPTGHVWIGAIARLLIEDFDVIPRKPDWERVLGQHEQALMDVRHWS